MIKAERFNSLSHLLGAALALALALAGAVVLVVVASQSGDARRIVSFSIYGATLFLLYLVYTLYHGLPPGRAKHIFGVFDHQAIYLLIAGSYTPFTLISLDGIVGWWMFGAVWGMAVLGLVLETNPGACLDASAHKQPAPGGMASSTTSCRPLGEASKSSRKPCMYGSEQKARAEHLEAARDEIVCRWGEALYRRFRLYLWGYQPTPF